MPIIHVDETALGQQALDREHTPLSTKAGATPSSSGEDNTKLYAPSSPLVHARDDANMTSITVAPHIRDIVEEEPASLTWGHILVDEDEWCEWDMAIASARVGAVSAVALS